MTNSMFLRNLYELLYEKTQMYKERPFLFYTEDGREFSYRSFEDRVEYTSNLIHNLGVSRGDTVGIMVPNSPEFLFTYLGSMKLGAIANPINGDDDQESIKYRIEHPESEILFVDKSYVPKIERIQENVRVGSIVSVESDTSYNILERTRRISIHNLSKAIDEDIALIIYTSGTTSRPKGCLLTHHNILTDVEGIVNRQKFDEETRMICTLPLFHVSAQIISFMSPLYSGGSIVLNKRFSASKFWEIVEKYGITIANVVPTILINLLNGESQEFTLYDTSSMKRILCGAAPLPIEVIMEFERKFNIPIIETYGLTETTCVASSNPPDISKRKVGSIGLPLDINSMAIVDDEANELANNEVGEITIKGENVFKGYLKMPKETEDVFRNGWFHSGDLGYKDEDGYFFIVGRKKDIINRGGEKISPREVEEILYSNPLIQNVVAVRVRDNKYGEHVGIVVELKQELQMVEKIRREIQEYCRNHLAEFKQPEEIFFIGELGLTEIPRGPSGKLLRRLLEEKVDLYMEKK